MCIILKLYTALSILLLKPQVSVTVTQGVSVVGVAVWLLTGWPVTVGVSASQQQTLSGRGALVYITHRSWLGVVTGISASSTGGVLVP